MKIPIVWGSESFSVGKHTHTQWGMHASSTRTGAPALGTRSDLALCISSSGCSSVAFIISYSKMLNVNASLSSMSLSSKLFESEEGVVETSDLWLVSQKHKTASA